jgi:hypothetical protein
VGLERGPLSLVRITENGKSSGSGSRKPRLTSVRIRCADHATPFIRKSWHQFRRHTAVANIVRLRTKAMEFSCLLHKCSTAVFLSGAQNLFVGFVYVPAHSVVFPVPLADINFAGYVGTLAYTGIRAIAQVVTH